MPRAPRNAADEFACINVGNHYKGDSCVLCHHRAVCVRDGPSKDWRHRGVDVLIFGALQWNMEVSNEWCSVLVQILVGFVLCGAPVPCSHKNVLFSLSSGPYHTPTVLQLDVSPQHIVTGGTNPNVLNDLPIP